MFLRGKFHWKIIFYFGNFEKGHFVPLPMATQAKKANTSENEPKEVREIIYSMRWAKQITKKVSNFITNSIYKKQKGYYIHEFGK